MKIATIKVTNNELPFTSLKSAILQNGLANRIVFAVMPEPFEHLMVFTDFACEVKGSMEIPRDMQFALFGESMGGTNKQTVQPYSVWQLDKKSKVCFTPDIMPIDGKLDTRWTFVCNKPHEDRDYGYTCGDVACKCMRR